MTPYLTLVREIKSAKVLKLENSQDVPDLFAGIPVPTYIPQPEWQYPPPESMREIFPLKFEYDRIIDCRKVSNDTWNDWRFDFAASLLGYYKEVLPEYMKGPNFTIINPGPPPVDDEMNGMAYWNLHQEMAQEMDLWYTMRGFSRQQWNKYFKENFL